MPKPDPKRQKQVPDKVLCVKSHKFVEESTTCQKCNKEVNKYIICCDFFRPKPIENLHTGDNWEKWKNGDEKIMDMTNPKCIRLCMDCSFQCVSCESWVCDDIWCSSKCFKCAKPLCKTCSGCCKECKSMPSSNCQLTKDGKHSSVCERCGACVNCLITAGKTSYFFASCDFCQKKVCEDCSRECIRCGGIVCTFSNCSTRHFCWGC